MKLSILIMSSALVMASSLIGEQESPSIKAPLNQALAETPRAASISLTRTGPAVDGGSVLNEIRFSDGRVYVLSLDFPFDLMSDKLLHSELHFTIFAPGNKASHIETIEHNSAAERRLIRLLESLVATTVNPHEKKNASSLVTFLRDRHQAFPRARGGSWDITPWSSPTK